MQKLKYVNSEIPQTLPDNWLLTTLNCTIFATKFKKKISIETVNLYGNTVCCELFAKSIFKIW